MGNLSGGVISGLVFGAFVVATMLPMQFPDKMTALLAAFISRFGIGLVIGCVQLPWPGWLIGLVFGLLLSIPDALITKAYAPILIIGTIGGAGHDPQRFPTLASFGHGVAAVTQRLSQRPPNERLVIHDQHVGDRGILRRDWE